MLFNSVSFLIFLPIVFIIYWALPHKYRWICICISSCIFYMSWKPEYIVLILFSAFVSYLSALYIDKTSSSTVKKTIMVLSVIICFIPLVVFKYANFLLDNYLYVLRLFGRAPQSNRWSLLLPVGISFYTFQTVSYIIDVYRLKIQPEKNFGYYFSYISFFPQLVAGPIERAGDLLPQIKTKKEFDYYKAISGLRLMLLGFFKKVAVADSVSLYVDNAYNSLHTCQGCDFLFASFLFTIQIYCDFSGYSDIAIGTAKLLGFNLSKNFLSPYLSGSLKEFWSRWHITLCTWFKDYVYIPLGGNRRSRIRNDLNLLITFLLSGLWHGADWSFVFWGGLHGMGRVIENHLSRFLIKLRSTRIGALFLGLLTFAFCSFLWIFFRAESIHDALFVVTHLFNNISSPSVFFYNTIGLTRWVLVFLGLKILAVFIIDTLFLKKAGTDLISIFNKKPFIYALEYLGIVVIFVSLLFNSGANQFVYFQF